ncbi:hypothetical protein ACNSPD_04110 [Yersinia enterocolitica]|uniref:hypothetical protein n=1 Tax=Yersinia enterocolitica TaxID=630 RepID=UPI003AB76628
MKNMKYLQYLALFAITTTSTIGAPLRISLDKVEWNQDGSQIATVSHNGTLPIEGTSSCALNNGGLSCIVYIAYKQGIDPINLATVARCNDAHNTIQECVDDAVTGVNTYKLASWGDRNAPAYLVVQRGYKDYIWGPPVKRETPTKCTLSAREVQLPDMQQGASNRMRSDTLVVNCTRKATVQITTSADQLEFTPGAVSKVTIDPKNGIINVRENTQTAIPLIFDTAIGKDSKAGKYEKSMVVTSEIQ